MNFLIDVHLPISLAKYLNNLENCTSVHVNQILQKWFTSDSEICRYADKNDMIVVSKDSDFKNSHFINKTPKKIIRIVLGNVSNTEIITLFEKYLPFIAQCSAKKHFYIELGPDELIIID
jgi:predicted nuclease of predicted toxin-antitoxin system